MTDWYTDEDFWRKFGPLMFGDEQFSEAAEQVPALLARIGLSEGAVLDLGCGPGRHALPLARAGLKVTAMDTSEQLLEELRQRAAKEQLQLEVRREDMRDFSDAGSFDAVFVMWTSFGYFEAEADHDCVLDNVVDSLKPGGVLVLDLVGLETLCRTLKPVHLTENADGSLLIERPVLVDHNTRLENEWILVRDNRADRAMFSHRVWSAGEIARLIEAAGLTLEAIDGDLQGTPYDFESERMYVFGRKP